MSSHYTSVITDGFYYTRLFHLYYLTSCMWPLGAKIFCLLLLLLFCCFYQRQMSQKCCSAKQKWRCQINIFHDKSTIHPAPGVHGRGSDLAGKLLLGLYENVFNGLLFEVCEEFAFQWNYYLLIKSSTRAAHGKLMPLIF